MVIKKNRKTIVTVNGHWPNQEEHVKTFENPCFTEDELNEANTKGASKFFGDKLSIAFVGRAESEKGLGILLDSLPLMKMKEKIDKVWIVGEGPQLEYFKKKACGIDFNIEFLGAIKRADLDKIYSLSHIFCLPSYASEGFPKVIAEAATYGCIPVVSSVSSISQYIFNDINGIIIKKLTANKLADQLDALFLNSDKMKSLSSKSLEIGRLYTYKRYKEKIRAELSKREVAHVKYH